MKKFIVSSILVFSFGGLFLASIQADATLYGSPEEAQQRIYDSIYGPGSGNEYRLGQYQDYFNY